MKFSSGLPPRTPGELEEFSQVLFISGSRHGSYPNAPCDFNALFNSAAAADASVAHAGATIVPAREPRAKQHVAEAVDFCRARP